jgi:hypothetical protein
MPLSEPPLKCQPAVISTEAVPERSLSGSARTGIEVASTPTSPAQCRRYPRCCASRTGTSTRSFASRWSRFAAARPTASSQAAEWMSASAWSRRRRRSQRAGSTSVEATTGSYARTCRGRRNLRDAEPRAGCGLETEVQDPPGVGDRGSACVVHGEHQAGQYGPRPHAWWPRTASQHVLQLLGQAGAVEDGQQLSDLRVWDLGEPSRPQSGPRMAGGQLVGFRPRPHERRPRSKRITSVLGSGGTQWW